MKKRKQIYIFKKRLVTNRNAWIREKAMVQSERDKKNASEDDVKRLMEKIRTGHEENLAGGGAAIEAAEARLALVRAPGVNKWAGRNVEIGDVKRLVELSESEGEEEDEKGRAKKRQKVEDKKPGREAAAGGDEKSGEDADLSDDENAAGSSPGKSAAPPQSDRKRPVKKEAWFDRDKAVSRAERSASTWRTTQHKAAEKLAEQMSALESDVTKEGIQVLGKSNMGFVEMGLRDGCQKTKTQPTAKAVPRVLLPTNICLPSIESSRM